MTLKITDNDDPGKCPECRNVLEESQDIETHTVILHRDCLNTIKQVNAGNICPQCGNPAIASFMTCLTCQTGHLMVNYKPIIEARLKKLSIRYSSKKVMFMFYGLIIGYFIASMLYVPELTGIVFAFLIITLVYLLWLRKFRPEKYLRFVEYYQAWIDRNWTQSMLFSIIDEIEENE